MLTILHSRFVLVKPAVLEHDVTWFFDDVIIPGQSGANLTTPFIRLGHWSG